MSAVGPFVIDMAREQKQEFGLDFFYWLDTDETISSVSTSWTDEDGSDASSLETGSPSIDGSIVKTTKDENTGTGGTNYFVVFTATTSEGRVLGGTRIGTVKLRITENF